MEHLRAFIAGIALPSVLVPILMYIALAVGKPQLLSVPFIHVIPLLWGIWNVLYFAFFKRFFPRDINMRLLLTGALLGLLVALYGIFWIHLPTILGFPHYLRYMPLIAIPIVYALLWRYVVKPLNGVLGLKDNA
jgi:hypothetical protein